MVKIAPRQADAFVKNPDPAVRAVLVYGPDEGQVRERAKLLGQTVVTDMNDPFNVAEFSAEALLDDPAKLGDEMAALSMMGGRRLVRVHVQDVQARDVQGKIVPVVKAWLENAVGDNLAVFEAGDLSTRSALRKLFEQAKNAAAVACYVEDERNLARLIQDTLRNNGFTAQRDAVAYLAQNLAGDRAVARGEVEKLMLYMGAGKNITLEDAAACVGNQAEISLDALTQSAASGKTAAMGRELHTLFSEGASAVYILRAMQTYFRRLHITKARLEQGESMEAALGKLQPKLFWKVEKPFQAQLRSWTLPKLTRVLDELGNTEAQCKKTGAPDQVLCERTLFVISRMAQR